MKTPKNQTEWAQSILEGQKIRLGKNKAIRECLRQEIAKLQEQLTEINYYIAVDSISIQNSEVMAVTNAN